MSGHENKIHPQVPLDEPRNQGLWRYGEDVTFAGFDL